MALKATSKLDIRYMKYLARTPLFQKSIVRATYGIDDEKFVFKDKWWMKELIPLPPVAEQRKICDLLDSNEEVVFSEEKRLKGLVRLKTGLMQDLLTGRVRVDGVEGVKAAV